MPKKDPLQPDRCAVLLSALAAPERLKIVRYLADGPQTVTKIAQMLKLVNVVNVSHHLSVLKHANLIAGKKKGRFVWYSLRPGVLEEVVEAGVPADALNLGCCRLELPPSPALSPPRARTAEADRAEREKAPLHRGAAAWPAPQGLVVIPLPRCWRFR